jgi:SAM-dependent methyltransferase
MDEKTWLQGEWSRDSYQKAKYTSFELIDSFLTSAPLRILDIGCGLAFESEHFQKKYNCELYLLDGDFDSTADRARDRKYGEADSMKFYTKLETLAESYTARGMRFHQVNANDIKLEDDLVFDLVYSNISCGFHYPIATYLDLLRKHTNEHSIMIFDVLSRTTQEQIGDQFEIVQSKRFVGKKIVKTQIKIL